MSAATTIDRHARWLMLILYVVLLGGSFSLSRIAPALPELDLRWVGLLAVTLAGAAWAAGVAQHPGWQRRLGAGPTIVLLWCGWAALSGVWSPLEARSAEKVTDVLLMAGLLAVAFSVLRRCSTEALASIWTWVFWTAVIYLIGALAAGPGDQGRFAAFGGGPNVFVRVMILGVVAATYLAVKQRRLFAVAIPWFIVGAVLSGSRGGLLALLLVALPIGFRLVRRVPRRVLVVGVSIFVVIIATAPLYASNFLDLIRRRFIEQTLETGYDSGRAQIFVDTWNIAKAHTWSGAGLDSYYALIGRVRGYEYPHNIVLESFADGGLVGLILVVGALITMFVTAVRSGTPLSAESVAALAAASLLFIASMTSGSYYDVRFLWFFLAVAVASSREPASLARRRTSESRVWAASVSPR